MTVLLFLLENSHRNQYTLPGTSHNHDDSRGNKEEYGDKEKDLTLQCFEKTENYVTFINTFLLNLNKV